VWIVLALHVDESWRCTVCGSRQEGGIKLFAADVWSLIAWVYKKLRSSSAEERAGQGRH
jgi:hypothetical protein